MHGDLEEEAGGSSGPQPSKNAFVVHQLSKLDTLAGLAVRYHVSVSDIKRANSLLSDTAMFARDSLIIPTRPLPMGQEYSAWAGMIVSQYGQISRTQAERPHNRYSNSQPAQQSRSAIDELRAHYGLSAAGSPSSTASREYAHSEDGFSSGRVPGEVEMQDLAGPEGGAVVPRRPSLPELNRYAGERNGPAGDERLRRRRAGESDEAWGGQESSGSPPSSGSLHSGHILPAAAAQVSPDRARRKPPLFGSPEAAPQNRCRGRGGAAVGRQASAGAAAPGPGRRRESLLERIKRAASQPALAGPSGPSHGSIADGAIASIKRPPPEHGARALLHEAAASLHGPKGSSKKE